MNDPNERPLPAEEPDSESPLRTFVGLFFVPLLVVILCVGVFIGFGWIAYDHHTTQDYLNDLRSGWRPRRAQAAYELSKILVADPGALDDTPGAKAELRRLYAAAEDHEIKRYLVLVLGHTRDPEAAPLLIDALDDPDSQTRIYAIIALGVLGDARAEAPLIAALADRDAGVRKTAAHALGELGRTSAVAALQPLLEDPVADVRWNAALSLSRLGSDAAVPVLYEMVDRDRAGAVQGITPAQAEDAMIGAVSAMGSARLEQARPLLQQLADGDPNLKVRRAALEALAALDR